MVDFPPVFILAGGLGTRVSSLYPDMPKAMVPVNGEPFIAHQLRLLAREKVRQVILCVGHRCEPLVEYVGSGKNFGLNVRYSYDGEKLLGTGGAIRKASKNLEIPFAVLYGDSYLDTRFAPILDNFQHSRKLALMTVFKNNNHWIPSNIMLQSGLVINYDKDQTSAEMQYVDYGLSLFPGQFFENSPGDESFDLAVVFQALIKKRQLAVHEVKERFYQAGSQEGIKELEAYLAKKKTRCGI